MNNGDIGFSYVFKRDGGLCRYCGAAGEARDHVRPRALGGRDDPFTNIVLACKPCNSTKSREGGFTLERGALYYEGRLISPTSGLYGDVLWDIVRWKRLKRQAASGLTWAQERLA